jgi:hypothetical protein
VAVRYSALGQNYTVTASLGAQTQISACGWVKITNDRNTNSAFISIGSSLTDYWSICTDVDGTSMRFFDDTANFGAFAMTVGTWYFVAASTNGANGSLWVRALTATTTPTPVPAHQSRDRRLLRQRPHPDRRLRRRTGRRSRHQLGARTCPPRPQGHHRHPGPHQLG